MAVRSKAERAKRAETWTAYLAAMAELRASANGLVVALTQYLRNGGGDYNHCPPPSVLMPAMDAERRYAVALRAAEPYHLSTLPSAPSIVNDDGPALLATLRAVRGDDHYAVTTIVPSADGFERRAVVPRFVSGVADWVDGEIRSMAKFGSPRRDPSEGISRTEES